MKRSLTALILLLSVQQSFGQAVTDAELNKAFSVCEGRRNPRISNPPAEWQSGFEYCQALHDEMKSRRDTKEANEQFAKGIADRLKKQNPSGQN